MSSEWNEGQTLCSACGGSGKVQHREVYKDADGIERESWIELQCGNCGGKGVVSH